jgi:hypothetical protein
MRDKTGVIYSGIANQENIRQGIESGVLCQPARLRKNHEGANYSVIISSVAISRAEQPASHGSTRGRPRSLATSQAMATMRTDAHPPIRVLCPEAPAMSIRYAYHSSLFRKRRRHAQPRWPRSEREAGKRASPFAACQTAISATPPCRLDRSAS